jgi:outer membrane protein TolC
MRQVSAIIAGLMLAWGPSRGAVAQEKAPVQLDLARAITMALAQNRTLAKSAIGASITALNILKEETAFQVDVRPELYLDYGGEKPIVGAGLAISKKLPWGTQASVEGVLAGTSSEGSTASQKILRLEITQPLFRNFGELIQREGVVQAEQGYRMARRALEIQKSAMVLSVVSSYENILQLERQVLVEQASAERMDKLVKLAHGKELLGRTTRVDTLRAELLRGQAQYSLESIQESLSVERTAFAELLGVDPETKFELKPTVLVELNVPPTEEALRTALQNRLDYAQVLQDGEDAARGVRIAGRSLWPGLNLIVGKNWTSGEPLTTVPAPDNKWTVGVSLDMNLNKKAERAALEQARLSQSSENLEVGISELTIAREISQARAACRRAQAGLQIAERNKELAASRRKLAQKMFDLGRSDQFSVTDAEETFLLAENQWLAARGEASLAGYRFLYVLGTLIEAPEDLKPRRSPALAPAANKDER